MLPWIDALRGLAILMVLANHVALQVPGLSAPLRALASFGQMGVQLFFVASAYTLCLSWQQRAAVEACRREAGGAETSHHLLLAFLLRRFFRIAPLYWFAIVFFSCWHLAFAESSNEPESAYTLAHQLANALFIHGLLPSAQNAVVPGGWSIGVEMVFYALFPALLQGLQGLQQRRPSWPPGLGAALAALFLLGLHLLWQSLTRTVPLANNSADYFHPLNQLPVFLLGMAWFDWRRQLPRTGPLAGWHAALLLSLLPLASCALLWRSTWPLAFALIPSLAGLGFVLLAQGLSHAPRLPDWLCRIGRASYAIYIIHILFAWHGLHALQALWPLSGDGAYLLALLLVSAMSYAAARLLGRCIERPGIALGARLIQRLQATPQSPAKAQVLIAQKGLK
ncbi:acyltransferase [Paucibacter sp. AS339]|uniref:acyltransferase family protein n=1 Tax=Paucibacter hankyongi TaxID=3133434 RepID=UPI0030A4DA72